MDKRITLIGSLLALILIAGIFVLVYLAFEDQQPPEDPGVAETGNSGALSDDGPSNATYTIEGEQVTLVRGRAETELAGSQTVVEVTGDPVAGDLNGDGQADVLLMLTTTAGDAGNRYYLAAAIRTQSGYEGSNAVLLGNQIAPQEVRISSGVGIVKYRDRRADEPTSSEPTVNKVINATFQEEQLVIIGQNF